MRFRILCAVDLSNSCPGLTLPGYWDHCGSLHLCPFGRSHKITLRRVALPKVRKTFSVCRCALWCTYCKMELKLARSNYSGFDRHITSEAHIAASKSEHTQLTVAVPRQQRNVDAPSLVAAEWLGQGCRFTELKRSPKTCTSVSVKMTRRYPLCMTRLQNATLPAMGPRRAAGEMSRRRSPKRRRECFQSIKPSTVRCCQQKAPAPPSSSAATDICRLQEEVTVV